MPNQLSKTKSRKSMTEHKAILAILDRIAQIQGTTSMALMREAVRDSLRKRLEVTSRKNWLWPVVMRFAPKTPNKFARPSQLSRFKRSQREFDKMLLDLNLTAPDDIESRNSVVSPRSRLRVFELERIDDKP